MGTINTIKTLPFTGRIEDIVSSQLEAVFIEDPVFYGVFYVILLLIELRLK